VTAPDAVGRVRRFTRGAQKTGGKPSAVDVPLAAVEAVFNGRFCLTRKLLPSVFTRHQLNPRVREDERCVGARLARLACEAPRTSTTLKVTIVALSLSKLDIIMCVVFLKMPAT
jgi:hypothetical protein